MTEDFVEWDVHATTDVHSPRVEYNDPLTQFSESEYCIHESKTSLPSIIPSSSPILDSSDSFPASVPLPPMKTAKVESLPVVLPMKVTISEPQKHQDGTQGAFVTWLLTTNTNVEVFKSTNPRPVRRRYQDFTWLHTVLSLEYPACIIPPLPEKHRLEYVKGDRFSAEFIQKRQISLQWFLDRLSRHPILQKSQCTRIFLESTDFKTDKRSHVLTVPPTTSIIDSISDTLVNAFAKIKKRDERFEDLKDNVNRLQENLAIIERLYTRIDKRKHDIQNDYAQFANSIQVLSSLETNIASSLYQFAETTKAYSKAMKEMTENEELQFLNEIHELVAYCQAAKDVLKSRDQKQLDFEALTVYLNQTLSLKEHTQHPGKKLNDGVSGLYITDYVTDKLKEVSGVNMVKARRDKLAKLERRVAELQDEVARANDETNSFSNQVLKEFETFQQTKMLELKQGLLAYADCHIEFYQKGMTIWENIIPVLEKMNDTTRADDV